MRSQNTPASFINTMDELEQPLTEIEQSRADTGFRYYVVQPDVYTGLVAAVDADRQYPNKQGTTMTGLPPVESLAKLRMAVGDSLLSTAGDSLLTMTRCLRELR